MIGKILQGIMTFIISLVNLLLAPIDLIISNALPSLDNAFTGIARMFNSISSVMGWCLSFTLLSSETISLIILYFTFALSVPLVVSTVKLALKWYDKLKP